MDLLSVNSLKREKVTSLPCQIFVRTLAANPKTVTFALSSEDDKLTVQGFRQRVAGRLKLPLACFVLVKEGYKVCPDPSLLVDIIKPHITLNMRGIPKSKWRDSDK